MRQFRLREILGDHIPTSGREEVSPVDVLVLLAVNLTLAKDPLYQLPQWVDSLDLRALGYSKRPSVRFTDDRFARALDKLYEADRTSLLTCLAVSAIKAFDVQCNRIHNDSTSIKAYGRIAGKTRSGLELRRGHSKDHRPDLKQLIYSLSISDDGAVPIHHQLYSGNRTDDTTHIETWNALRQIHGSPDFLYVADCKLCTNKQLTHIVDHGGKAITIVPQNYLECGRFHKQLRSAAIPKKLLWRRPKPNHEHCEEYFYLFGGQYQSDPEGYPLYWIRSSEKMHRDRSSREQRLSAAEVDLAVLAPKLNVRRLKRKADIQLAVQGILKGRHVEGFFDVRISAHVERLRQRPRGRPGEKVHYTYKCRGYYSLHWSRHAQALVAEARTDGVFPLLCTDPSISPKRVLQAYKFQPRIEKRFAQFKSVHLAAPLLFKKIERVEANMFVFFIALMIQALLERLIRQQLKLRKAPALKLYPEDRDAPHPTTSQLFKTFESLSTYSISEDDRLCEEYHDQLTEAHYAVLSLLDITENAFWKSS